MTDLLPCPSDAAIAQAFREMCGQNGKAGTAFLCDIEDRAREIQATHPTGDCVLDNVAAAIWKASGNDEVSWDEVVDRYSATADQFRTYARTAIKAFSTAPALLAAFGEGK